MGNITQNVQKYKYFAIFLLVGICFMLLSVPISDETVVTAEENYDIYEIESKFEEILQKIDKVGEVSVMITIESGTKNVFATNDDTEIFQDGTQIVQSEYVIVSPSGGTQQPIKVYEIFPEIRGVLVVCEGGDLPEVKFEILNAVRALFGVSSEKITISKMKG